MKVSINWSADHIIDDNDDDDDCDEYNEFNDHDAYYGFEDYDDVDEYDDFERAWKFRVFLQITFFFLYPYPYHIDENDDHVDTD